ncbi:DUF4974 domain-containing protein [Chitinophaga sp. SYP-B3965]|uniref:FecR family protein n=1 Tax=Chitinophaga sp. SYP-B3965 TaxID=2663120 RepID=UPI001299F69B|nr:FecR family protein [Chitinophaga sp. SYP-B3965]MRG45474.1 DUF4974 domain-containing protein [Chitinophaga sp. SYP-B3965]
MDASRFSVLLELYVTAQLSREDKAEFLQMLDSGLYNAQLEKMMEEDWHTGRYEQEEDPQLRSLIIEQVNKKITKKQIPWLRYAAAILLLVSIGTYLWWPKNEIKTVADVAPGGTKATLTLANGTIVTLDSAGHQSIQQGKTAVLQQGGLLQYHAEDAGNEVQYNMLTTPRGGQFRIILPDGSKVWLNAASSIRYPTAFAGKERLVEITGEAYFEITHDANMPFIVAMQQGNKVEVLGTHFNVNTYPDEPNMQTTLLEGAVRISNVTGQSVLSPGQQATVSKNNTIRIVQTKNAAQVIAWKDGLFNFDDASLEDVMRQLSRWYDIEVVYEKGVPDIGFGGKIGRDLSLTNVLGILERAEVHFKLEEGKKLIVTP